MRFFWPERSLNQQKAKRVFIRSINQPNRSTFDRLLFLFCSLVFISRSYENPSNFSKNLKQKAENACHGIEELERPMRHWADTLELSKLCGVQ